MSIYDEALERLRADGYTAQSLTGADLADLYESIVLPYDLWSNGNNYDPLNRPDGKTRMRAIRKRLREHVSVQRVAADVADGEHRHLLATYLAGTKRSTMYELPLETWLRFQVWLYANDWRVSYTAFRQFWIDRDIKPPHGRAAQKLCDRLGAVLTKKDGTPTAW